MPGPPPKHPSKRRRVNKTTGRRVLAADGPRRRAPALGSRKPVWLKTTREWWTTIWASPMAAAWIEADVPALRRLAGLMERVSRGDTHGSILAEIRQLEMQFGLTPLARRRLEWEIVGEMPDESEAPAQPEREPDEDGRWLRAVK